MITIQIPDDQMEQLAQLIAGSPQMAKLVTDRLGGTAPRVERKTYTVAEVATLLGKCTKTIERRIKAKQIPTIPNISPPTIPAAWIDRQLNPNPDA